MIMGDNETELKKDFMVKRAQMKSTITSENYKSRWFVLTPSVLRYHEGSLEKGIGNEKGRVFLNTVRVIENVDSKALASRDWGFQVVYSPDGTSFYSLYIIAQSENSRKEWIAVLRETCRDSNAPFIEKYHPGVWKKGKFSCCEQNDRNAIGCKPTFDQPRLSRLAMNKANGTGYTYTVPEGLASPNVRNTPLPPTPTEAKSQVYVIALYDYAGELTNQDLPLTKGEEYAILDNSREHWWKAQNKNGDVGYIPSNYVQVNEDRNEPEGKKKKENLEKFEWYYKNLSRPRCEVMLKDINKEGCFLVRDSQVNPGQYTVSILSNERSEPMVRHYHIKKTDKGQYYLSVDHPRNTIHELIFYHQHNAAGLVVRLRDPPSRAQSQPTTAGLGHDKWELDPSELVMGAELGRGQFGSVLKARWRNITWVAVKMMQAGAMSEDDFIDEAKTMQQLQHPNLVQLYGVCTKSRPIFIVTEFMTHGALLNYLRRHRKTFLQKPGYLLEMCVQVCKGMQYLEERNFIHRDLAARNCLVGENEVVKVADFGLARYVLDDEYTSSAGSKFPIKWAPPEVLAYTKFSTKSDVWAFGIFMWEVFTGGEMPYGRMKNQDVVDFICHRKQRLAKPDVCPTEVYEVMFRTWHHKPENRPTFETLSMYLSRLQEEGDYAE